MTAGATAPRLFALVAAIALAAVGAALYTQHVWDMRPCPWCVLQRLIFVLIAAFGLLGLAWRGTAGRALAFAGVFGFALAGVAAALWQHFVAASSTSCNLTLADRIIAGLRLDEHLPAVFMPMASCADAAVKLFGVWYEFWSLGLFVLLGALAVAALRAPRR